MPALPEARESLAYWEGRLERLPRRAVRKRREARVMVDRWRSRVVEAERGQYGSGLLGAALMVLAERRLPTDASYASRRVARVASRVALATFLALVTLMVVAGVVLVEIIRAL